MTHPRHAPAPGTSASVAPAITLLPQLQGRKPEILWKVMRVDPAKTNRPGVVDGGSRPGARSSFFEGVVDSRVICGGVTCSQAQRIASNHIQIAVALGLECHKPRVSAHAHLHSRVNTLGGWVAARHTYPSLLMKSCRLLGPASLSKSSCPG